MLSTAYLLALCDFELFQKKFRNSHRKTSLNLSKLMKPYPQLGVIAENFSVQCTKCLLCRVSISILGERTALAYAEKKRGFYIIVGRHGQTLSCVTMYLIIHFNSDDLGASFG